MGTRADELRRRDRRVLAWSLAVAAVLHVGVFVASPTFRAEPLGYVDLELDTIGAAGGGNALVRVVFGPTIVKVADGADWKAPSQRVLAAERAVRLPERCLGLTGEGRAPVDARVGLRIKPSGRVDVLGLVARTGDACADQVLSEVAGALWYHWLPNERFPAPVHVEQPVTLLGATYAGFQE